MSDTEPAAVIIIPARSGSKGIPGKNMIPCAGKPLLQWTLETALAVDKENSVPLLSSNDAGYRDFALAMDVGTVARPDDLAGDDSPTEDTIEHTLEAVFTQKVFRPGFLDRVDAVVLLQPTSPVRTATQVRECLALLRVGGFDSVVSVTPSHHFLWDTKTHTPRHDLEDRPMRQHRDSQGQAVENGNIYAFTLEHWKWTMNRLGGKISTYKMGEDYGLQVDSEFDLWMVEKVLERKTASDPGFHTK